VRAFQSLTNQEQLNRLLESSKDRTVLLFKHSTVCPVSAAAYDELCQFGQSEAAKQVDIGVVTVIEHRPVSNEIERRLGIKHESPQAILLRDGCVVWHASHWHITEEAIREALQT
jgi:bacillithiol system protein YtxJ